MPHMHLAVPPDKVHPTTGPYTHAFEVAANQRMLFVSGQVPLAPDGTVPAGIVAQTELVWQNLHHILDVAGMTLDDIVKLTHYIVGLENLEGYNSARGPLMAGIEPVSTLLIVAGLARPEFLVEVDLVAAKP